MDRSQLVFSSIDNNHPSAEEYASDVEMYLSKELKHQSIVRPFTSLPFEVHYSPMLTRPKPDDTRHVIVNLSYPYHASVNDNISADCYDDIEYKLKYPSVDNIVDAIKALDSNALLSKIDISRAFRNLRVDPYDFDLLGLKWHHDSYLDLSVPMGLKTGSAMCQRTTDVIRHVMRSKNIDVYNYLDDIICVHQIENASEEFDTLYSLFEFLGLPINPKKVVPPTRALTCMGILIDIDAGKMLIPREKCTQILDACKVCLTRKFLTKKQLQSLLGKLIYLHRCVKPAHVFMNRLLNYLRDCTSRILVTDQMKQDINWFVHLLTHFNCQVMFPHERNPSDVYVDASLTGLGGCWHGKVYAVSRNVLLTASKNITQLELLNVLVAMRCFAHKWVAKYILFHIDNQSAVYILNKGKTRDPFMQSVVRSIWLIAATNDIQIAGVHVPGTQNGRADILSRLFDGSTDNKRFHIFKNCKWWPIQGSWFEPDVLI